MNWSETMFKLDNLLDLELPSFISLAHNNQQGEKRKAKFYTLPIDEILPEHAINAIVNKQFKDLSFIYHNLEAKNDLQREAL